ncbi:MAG TPA: epoxide hydrolase N-terminal domain-containing protein [Gaiellaceae bacterium]|nr:epoxide hydrolase N-terminal domain-containing protein [Gaiellaceae bacterium]
MSTTVETGTAIRPFHVELPDDAIDDVRRRVAATRWPSKELVADRSQGVQLATAQALARSGPYMHRTIEGGIGHNLPQEAPDAFAEAVLTVGGGV